MKQLKNIFKLGTVLLLTVVIGHNASAASSESASADYNGTYMGRYVISKYLANFCEIPDDVIVGKIDVLKNCMDKLAGKMRSQSAQIAEEGKKDYGSVLADTWNMALTQAGTVLANKQNYEDDYNSLWQSTENTGGQHADQAAMADATEKQMSPFLALLAMHAERLKADALNNLPNVDPELLYVTPASGQKENVDYKGTKEDIQVVPNALAIYCELNGEDFTDVEKKDSVKKCLDTLLAKMNDKSSEESKQANDDYSVIMAEQAQTLMMQAVNKSVGNVEYDKARKAQATANSQTQTDFETTTSHAFVSTLQLQGINDFRTFFASGMKFTALKNLADVDAAAVIENMENDVNKDVKVEDFEANNQVEEVKVTVDPGEAEEVDPETADEDEAEIGYDDGNDPIDGNETAVESMIDSTGEAGGSSSFGADSNGGNESKDNDANNRHQFEIVKGDKTATVIFNGEKCTFILEDNTGTLVRLEQADNSTLQQFYEDYIINEKDDEKLKAFYNAYNAWVNREQ